MPCSICFEHGHNRRTCNAWHVLASQIDSPIDLPPSHSDTLLNHHDHTYRPSSRILSDTEDSMAFQWLTYIVATHFDLDISHTYDILTNTHVNYIYNIIQQICQIHYNDSLFDDDINSTFIENELEEGVRTIFEIFYFPDGSPIHAQLVKRLRPNIHFEFIHKLEELIIPIIQHKPIITRSLAPMVDTPCISDDCPICMDSLLKTDLFTTRCGHMFHGSCMITHLKLHNNCPMCRGILSL